MRQDRLDTELVRRRARARRARRAPGGAGRPGTPTTDIDAPRLHDLDLAAGGVTAPEPVMIGMAPEYFHSASRPSRPPLARPRSGPPARGRTAAPLASRAAGPTTRSSFPDPGACRSSAAAIRSCRRGLQHQRHRLRRCPSRYRSGRQQAARARSRRANPARCTAAPWPDRPAREYPRRDAGRPQWCR